MTLRLKLFDGPRDGDIVPTTQNAWPPAETIPANGGVYVLTMTADRWLDDVLVWAYADYQWLRDGAA